MEIPLRVIIFSIVFLVISFRNIKKIYYGIHYVKKLYYAINYIKKLYYGIPFVRPVDNIEPLALELADIYKKHRYPVIGTNLFHVKSVLVIRDLELIKCVLVQNFDCFQNRGLFYNEVDDPLSAILGTVDHEDWCSMKGKVSRSFRPAKMKSIFTQIENMCNGLVRNLSEVIDINGESIEIIELFSRFTIDAIAKIAFGQNNDESDRLFREMVMKAKQPYLKYPFNRFAVAYPKLARALRMRKHSKEVTDFFVKYVFEIVKYRAENDVRQDDFIQSWIDEGLEIHRIAAVGFDLLSAGFADSTSTLAYCLFEMSLNKTIQNRAREEINVILQENEELAYADLKKLRYVSQIIKEAERKYPVAGTVTREATKPFTFEGDNVNITIPCGMKVFIPIYGIHHDEAYYRNPEVFDPDRFTKESTRERPQYAYLPFGAGPRQCLGSKFAELIITIGLVKLLKNFEFSICALSKIPIQFNKHKNTLHPAHGVTLEIRRF